MCIRDSFAGAGVQRAASPLCRGAGAAAHCWGQGATPIGRLRAAAIDVYKRQAYMICTKYGVDKNAFAIESLPDNWKKADAKDIRRELSSANSAYKEIAVSYTHLDVYKRQEARLSELNALLNVDKKENEIVNDDNEIVNDSPQRSEIDRESR